MSTPLVLVVLLCLIYGIQNAAWVLSPNTIIYVNNQKPGWRAGLNPRFENVTRIEAGKLLGLKPNPNPTTTSEPVFHSIQLPDEFDSRTRWPSCAQPIRDQEGCGACWAFAGSSALGIRTCIAKNQASNVVLSTQYPTSCDTVNGGCDGGTLPDTWEFFKGTGNIPDSAYTWTDSWGITSACKAVAPTTPRYYISSYNDLPTVYDMMYEIYTNGPIQVGFDVYNDFFSYVSGVYSYTAGAFAGGHSVYLVGWGIDGYGVEYWIAINSWGTSWGMNGEFWIKKGVNMCKIESGYGTIAGYPTVATPATTTTTKAPTTTKPATAAPTTKPPTAAPTTKAPTVAPTTTKAPTTKAPTVAPTTTKAPTTKPPTTKAPTTKAPTVAPTTTKAPTTKAPTTKAPTTKSPTSPSTTKAPTTTKQPTLSPNMAVKVCPTKWASYDNKCYLLTGTQATWSDAKTKCASVGGYLVTVENQAENSFLLTLNSSNLQSAWLDLNVVNQKMVNSAGVAPSYTNFKTGADTSSGCVVQIRDKASSSVGAWKTEVCTALRTYYCEKLPL